MIHVNCDIYYGGHTFPYILDTKILIWKEHCSQQLSLIQKFIKVWSIIIFFRKIYLPLQFKNITLKNIMIFVGLLILTPIADKAGSFKFWMPHYLPHIVFDSPPQENNTRQSHSAELGKVAKTRIYFMYNHLYLTFESNNPKKATVLCSLCIIFSCSCNNALLPIWSTTDTDRCLQTCAPRGELCIQGRWVYRG